MELHLLPDVHWGAANCIRCLHRLTSAQEFLQVSSASLGHIKLIKNDWPHLSSHQQRVRAHTFKLLLLLACFFRLWGCQYGSHETYLIMISNSHKWSGSYKKRFSRVHMLKRHLFFIFLPIKVLFLLCMLLCFFLVNIQTPVLLFCLLGCF